MKTIKNREDRRNRYLLPLKCLFCCAEKSGLKDIMKMEQDQALIQEPAFSKLAEKYGKSNAQIILRWHIQAGTVTEGKVKLHKNTI